jgi:hypothetical protein
MLLIDDRCHPGVDSACPEIVSLFGCLILLATTTIGPILTYTMG